MKTLLTLGMSLMLALAIGACSEDANDLKVGGECVNLADCGVEASDGETPELDCLPEFKGGYCGKTGCAASTDCPEGSACADLEGTLYCFLVCNDKPDCNQNRTVDNESNCSATIKTVENTDQKLCIPPSAGE